MYQRWGKKSKTSQKGQKAPAEKPKMSKKNGRKFTYDIVSRGTNAFELTNNDK
jgi:hypothetical protein